MALGCDILAEVHGGIVCVDGAHCQTYPLHCSFLSQLISAVQICHPYLEKPSASTVRWWWRQTSMLSKLVTSAAVCDLKANCRRHVQQLSWYLSHFESDLLPLSSAAVRVVLRVSKRQVIASKLFAISLWHLLNVQLLLSASCHCSLSDVDCVIVSLAVPCVFFTC